MKRNRTSRFPRRYGQRRRRLVVEMLENRFLLTGDPLSSTQRLELINGLSYVANWTDSVANANQLDLPLAIAGKSIGESADVFQMINTGIVTQLNATSQSATDTGLYVDARKAFRERQGT